MELAVLFTKTTDLVGNFGIELGTWESLNDTTDPATAAAEGGNATGITPLSNAFHEEKVLVVKLVHLLIHNNTDIDYQMLVVLREHLCWGPVKPFFYDITCLILFASILSHRVTSLPLTLFQMVNFTNHLSFALKKGTIWWTKIYPHFLALKSTSITSFNSLRGLLLYHVFRVHNIKRLGWIHWILEYVRP